MLFQIKWARWHRGIYDGNNFAFCRVEGVSGLYSGDNLRESVGVVLRFSKFSYHSVSDLMEQTVSHHNFMR